MGKKRLKHAAHVLCHKFRGWELHADYDRLTAWGQGTLRIDALTGACLLDGEEAKLMMAVALRGWLRDDLRSNHIDPTEIAEATLEVTFSTEHYSTQRDRSISYGRPTGQFVGCHVHCESLIRTADRSYQASLDDTLEWPLSRSRGIASA